MTDRGSYRAIHSVIVDGPDFQALSADSRLALLVAKISLGPSGIDVLYPTVLEQRTGLPRPRLRRAVAELEASGWLRIDGNIAWVIRGLEFEPSFSVHHTGHRQSLQAHVLGLPRRPIVEAFRTHYRPWFNDTKAASVPPPPHPTDTGEAPECHEAPTAVTIEDRGERIELHPASGADAPADDGGRDLPSTPKRGRRDTSWVQPVSRVWEAHCGAGSFAAIRRQAVACLQPVLKAHGERVVCDALEVYLLKSDAQYRTVRRFASNFAAYKPVAPLRGVDGQPTPYFESLLIGQGAA